MDKSLAPYLFHQGTNYKAYDYMGAHLVTIDKVKGVVFRVFAPNAVEISVVGDFNNWDISKNKMNRITTAGIWELFIPKVKEFYNYKYAIKAKSGKVTLKSDLYAFYSELSPNTASKVYNLDGYKWKDNEYVKNRQTNSLQNPMNIYEVNLASWKKQENGDYYTYKMLKKELVKYVHKMGYTHVEFMPVSEYPFDGSWGYQVTGYYSMTSRFGTPKEFMELVDEFHKYNIGVIVDWVPAHFPKDEHGLYEYDGEPLYENHGEDRKENKVWGTRLFDYGRTEVQSFLISNAVFLFDKFHIDGLRVDAVAQMLYLDYDKEPGTWIPNIYGNNKNLEAIAFFHKLNKQIFFQFPYALMIAEESSADVKITGPVHDGGLGFNYKWNMGWMNDVLSYVEIDPLFRKDHHSKLTFSLMYSFSENFILPISHDEVVHGKKSLLEKMYGTNEEKFAMNRAFLGYMFAHPGKKLTFMGEEFGQYKEWAYKEGLEFFMMDYPLHKKLSIFYMDMNMLYKTHDALYSIDDSWQGFEWIDADNANNNIIAFKRKGLSGEEIIAVISFNGSDIKSYKLPVDGDNYKVLINSENSKYGGEYKYQKRIYKSKKDKNNNKYILIDLAKLSFIYLIKEPSIKQI